MGKSGRGRLTSQVCNSKFWGCTVNVCIDYAISMNEKSCFEFIFTVKWVAWTLLEHEHSLPLYYKTFCVYVLISWPTCFVEVGRYFFVILVEPYCTAAAVFIFFPYPFPLAIFSLGKSIENRAFAPGFSIDALLNSSVVILQDLLEFYFFEEFSGFHHTQKMGVFFQGTYLFKTNVALKLTTLIKCQNFGRRRKMIIKVVLEKRGFSSQNHSTLSMSQW